MAMYGLGDPLRRLPQFSAVTHMGDDKFEVFLEPSDRSVLRSTMFGQKEKRFLLDKLVVKTMSFSLRDTFSIFTRSVWQPVLTRGSKQGKTQGSERKQAPSPEDHKAPKSVMPAAPVVICLHDLDGDDTHGWVWMKFARAFYRKGFSVVFVDLPGFGKSQVAQQRKMEVDEWVGVGSHLLVKVIEDLGLANAHVAAVGKTAAFLLRALQRSPHRLGHRHILINPDLVSEIDDMFPFDPKRLNPGEKLRQKGKSADVSKFEAQAKLFQTLLQANQTRLWCIFEKDPGGHNLKMELTHRFIKKALGQDSIYGNLIGIVQVTAEDVTSARLDPKMDLRVMVPSRHMKHCAGEFMKGSKPTESPGQEFLPHHLQQTLSNKDLLMGSKEEAPASEEHSEDSASHSDGEQRAESAVPNFSVSVSICDDLARRSGAVARGMKPRKLRPTNFGKYEMVALEQLCPWAKKLGKKMSKELQRPGTSQSMQLADVEDDDPEALRKLEATRRDMSYGNRKFLQDTLDASLLSFEEEQHGIFSTARLAKASALKESNLAAAQREVRLANSTPANSTSDFSPARSIPQRNASKVSFAQDVVAAMPGRASSRTSQSSAQKLMGVSSHDMYGLGVQRDDTRLWTIGSEECIQELAPLRIVVHRADASEAGSRDGSRPGSNAGSRAGSRPGSNAGSRHSSMGQLGGGKPLTGSSSRGLLGSNARAAMWNIRISEPEG